MKYKLKYRKMDFTTKRSIIRHLLKHYYKVKAEASTMALRDHPFDNIKYYIEKEFCHIGICITSVYLWDINLNGYNWVQRNKMKDSAYWGITPRKTTSPVELIESLNLRIKILRREQYKFW